MSIRNRKERGWKLLKHLHKKKEINNMVLKRENLRFLLRMKKRNNNRFYKREKDCLIKFRMKLNNNFNIKKMSWIKNYNKVKQTII